MMPLVSAIEDLEGVLPDDARVSWDYGNTDCDYVLTIQNESRSMRFQVDTDTLIERGEAYRRFLVCVARTLGVMAVEFPDRRDHQLRMAAAAA
jgi:hypothetical protein